MHEIINIFSQKVLSFYYATSISGVTATAWRKLWATTLAFLVGRITAKQKSSASQLLLGVSSASVWPSHSWETHKYNYWSIVMTSQLWLCYPKLHLASMQKWFAVACMQHFLLVGATAGTGCFHLWDQHAEVAIEDHALQSKISLGTPPTALTPKP